jgi:hypothetical protein
MRYMRVTFIKQGRTFLSKLYLAQSIKLNVKQKEKCTDKPVKLIGIMESCKLDTRTKCGRYSMIHT